MVSTRSIFGIIFDVLFFAAVKAKVAEYKKNMAAAKLANPDRKQGKEDEEDEDELYKMEDKVDNIMVYRKSSLDCIQPIELKFSRDKTRRDETNRDRPIVIELNERDP